MTDRPSMAPTQYRLIGPSDSGEVSDLLADLSGKDVKHRLQALIAEWLRMENLVVLSGAGTSVTSGGKTLGLEQCLVAQRVHPRYQTTAALVHGQSDPTALREV